MKKIIFFLPMVFLFFTALCEADWVQRGDMYIIAGLYEKAIEAYNKALKIDSRNAQVYAKRGCAWRKKRNYDQAISDFCKAVEIDPLFEEAFFNRAITWKEKGDYDQAISDFSKAVEIRPLFAEAYNSRGIAWRKKRNYDQAISDFCKAVEIDPLFEEAFFNRAITWKEKGDYDQAISDFSKAVEINPRYGEALFYRAIMWQERGNYDEAISDMNNLLQIDPLLSEAYFFRSLIWKMKGDLHRALMDLNKALEIMPSSPKYKEAKAKLEAKIPIYDPEVLNAQKRLEQLQYNPGPLDGIWDMATKRAIEKFQRDMDLSVSGQLDSKTKARLEAAGHARDELSRLISQLNRKTYQDRYDAASLLKDLDLGAKAEPAIPNLIANLNIDVLHRHVTRFKSVLGVTTLVSTEPHLSQLCSDILVSIGDPAIDPLIDAFPSSDIGTKMGILATLYGVEASSLFGQIRESKMSLYKATTEQKQTKLALSLSRITYDYRHSRVGALALEAVNQIGEKAYLTAPDLLKILQDGSCGARYHELVIRKINILEPITEDIAKGVAETLDSTCQAPWNLAQLLIKLCKQNSGLRDIIVEVLSHEKTSQSFYAHFVLAIAGENLEVHVPPIIEVLEDDLRGWVLQEHAASALGEILISHHNEEVENAIIESLILALENNMRSIRFAAATALIKFGKPAVKPLIYKLKVYDPRWVRQTSAWALGRIGDPSAIKHLIDILNDKRVETLQVSKYGGRTMSIAEVASSALKEITGKDFGQNATEWTNWWRQNKESYLRY